VGCFDWLDQVSQGCGGVVLGYDDEGLLYIYMRVGLRSFLTDFPFHFFYLSF
jgi:hypothetical protein